MRVTVIGLGAMGGGMARSLLRSPSIESVTGFDLSQELVTSFHKEAKEAGKAATEEPITDLTLGKFINIGGVKTDVVLIVLVNETQCNFVCFDNGKNNLETIMKPGSCVILSSTVTPSWSKYAHDKFFDRNIGYLDCPISGGPLRALNGEITIMASGSQNNLSYVGPLLKALGKDTFTIPGGAGMGSTVKMIHQLLAGVHIVVAAEALALAAKAGVDVAQMYEIVNGAAGASWMFKDRGARMIESPQKVMSAISIFVKDMDIVYKEAKRLQSPIPLATAALQQFISGVGLGLGKEDDSQVVKVYELLSGKSVAKVNGTVIEDVAAGQGDNVGDIWVLPDGSKENILEVGDESFHKIALSNEYTRVLKVKFGPKMTTWAHRHAEDSLYFFLVEGGLNVINHVKGMEPTCDCMEFGEVRYGTHKSEKPLVHKITNMNDTEMFCIDAELLKRPPVTSPFPLVAECHELIKTRDRCRVYKLVLEVGKTVKVSYPFFHLSIIVKGSEVETSIGDLKHCIVWNTQRNMGDIEWHHPVADVTLKNCGHSTFEQYIAEWS